MDGQAYIVLCGLSSSERKIHKQFPISGASISRFYIIFSPIEIEFIPSWIVKIIDFFVLMMKIVKAKNPYSKHMVNLDRKIRLVIGDVPLEYCLINSSWGIDVSKIEKKPQTLQKIYIAFNKNHEIHVGYKNKKMGEKLKTEIR